MIVVVGARLARAQGDRNGRPYGIINLKRFGFWVFITYSSAQNQKQKNLFII